MTKRDILTETAVELGILDPGDTLGDREALTLSNKFDRLTDRWNAKGAAAFARAFNTYTLTPSLSPHTIGVTGATFTVTTGRPVSIEAAGLVLTTSTPDVRVPITIRDWEWWARESVKALESSIPTDLYYDPAWPLGKLFFWPVPDTAYSVELTTRVLLSTLGLNDDFDLPFGYRDAIILTLAEECAGPFAAEISALTVESGKAARALIFGNNTKSPRIATRDAGMPGGRRGVSTFNYLTRQGT